MSIIIFTFYGCDRQAKLVDLKIASVKHVDINLYSMELWGKMNYHIRFMKCVA